MTKGQPIQLKSAVSRLAIYVAILSVAGHAGAVGAQESPANRTIEQEQIQLSADKMSYDGDTSEVVAEGRILLVKDGYRLEAGKIIYNRNSGEAVATGAVNLIFPDGQQIWSDRVELNKNLKDAFITNVRLLMNDGAQVAAKSAKRDGKSGKTTLEKAVFTPCKVCEGDPNSEPIWQIKAVKVTHDKEAKRLYYTDAYLEFLGVPILWAPRFSHPDPTVDRAKGFLPVEVKTSKELGIATAIPYYYPFNKSRDITLTPIITTNEGVVLSSEYRQRLKKGYFDLSGSATYTDKRDELGLNTGREEIRGSFSSEGWFTHNDNWRSTYQINWASDDTYLRRYDFSDADTLVNEYNLEAFYGPSYFSARSLAFQGLRVEDVAGLTAFALPLIHAEYISKYKPLGGVFKASGNALALRRTDGLDMERFSVSLAWDKQTVFAGGLLWEADGLLRGDAYNIHDGDRPDDPAFAGQSDDGTRLLGRASSTLSWPLIKQAKATLYTIEPLVRLDLSPNSGHKPNFVNEDSRAIELSRYTLTSGDRAAGYDLWEEGSRLTAALKLGLERDTFNISSYLGQSYRDQSLQSGFADGTGLSGNFSSVVGGAEFHYKDWMSLTSDFRLNEDDWSFERLENEIAVHRQKFSLRIAHLKLNRDLSFINREDRQEIRGSGSYSIDKNWSLKAHFIEDLTDGSDGIEYGTGLNYEDECLKFSLDFRKTFTRDRDIEPGTAVMFRIKLKNLG